MSTFLQLVQQVASESGTISGTYPTTVVGQTGRLAKMVRWTNEAWRQLQNAHAGWLWMQGRFYGPTVASTQSYAGTSFTDADSAAAITRFAKFLVTGDGTEDRISLYDPAIGASDETILRFLNWDDFYRLRMRGAVSTDTGRPGWFTVSPQNKLFLSVIPDKVYTVRGLYRKSPQNLAADADTPEMPERFHDLVVEMALEYLGAHDESQVQFPLWRLRQFRHFSELERDELPPVTLAGALA